MIRAERRTFREGLIIWIIVIPAKAESREFSAALWASGPRLSPG